MVPSIQKPPGTAKNSNPLIHYFGFQLLVQHLAQINHQVY